MVNTFTMNIDVREYLRINPISVHELTLQGDAKDCFLFFKNDEPTYTVHTQKQLFWELCKAIFQDLIEQTEDGIRLNIESVSLNNFSVTALWRDVHLSDNQFTNYIKSWELQTFMDNFETHIRSLEEDIRNKLNGLKTASTVDYPGAVELQSQLVNRFRNLYEGFKYGLGEIWCWQNGQSMGDGSDLETIGELPLKHSHRDTKAETMTTSFSTKKGGGELIGEFAIGSSMRISEGRYAIASGTNLSPIDEAIEQSEITYPLWGQNVIDWRTREKTHNNVPPSLNIYIRYKERARDVAMARRGMIKAKSVAEAQYLSQTISQIDGEYGISELTTHDYLLRMALDDDGNVNLMKQTVEMFLDIFSDECASELGLDIDGYHASLAELVKPKLDEDLVPRQRFLLWYNTQIERMDKIESDIELIKELLVSINPMTYPGRIIMSATDDLETKVIAHYGGKKWRRIENFLRGVDDDDIGIGKIHGEEYVCLRESNIPLHTHVSQLSGRDSTGGKKWMMKDSGGETKMINLSSGLSDVELDGTENVQLDYQISPLEYENGNKVVSPHDNAPPYREVYIWECVEADGIDDIVGEEKSTFTISWDANGGTPLNIPDSTVDCDSELGQYMPLVENVGHGLVGWFTKPEGGQQVLENTQAKKDATYYAHWRANQYKLTFDARGGRPDGRFKKVTYGEPIGKVPVPTKVGCEFLGWEDSDGNAIGEETPYLVEGDSTVYAKWKVQQCQIRFNPNGGSFPSGVGIAEYACSYGDPVPSVQEEPARYGFTFNKWWTKPVAGSSLKQGDIVVSDMTYYAHWTTVRHNVTFDVNGGTEVPNPRITVEHGKTLGKLPRTIRDGYEFIDWVDEDGQGVAKTTEVNRDMTITAQWQAVRYPIAYVMNGVGRQPEDALTEYSVDILGDEGYVPPAAEKTGYIFLGWEPEKIPPGTVGDWTFYAGWRILEYVVTFDMDCELQNLTRTKHYGEYVGSVPVVGREGYKFIGWYTERNGNGDRIGNNERVFGDITYYAYWDVMMFDVTFDTNGGHFANDNTTLTVEYRYGKNIIAPESPTLESDWGQTMFEGWYTQPDGGKPLDHNTKVKSDVTYYAHWFRVIHYKKMGSVQDDGNGVLSDFSLTNYAKVVEQVDFMEDFDIVMNATTSDNITKNQEVFSVHPDHDLEFGVFSGKTMWEVLSPGNPEETLGNDVEPNTNYYFKLTWDNAAKRFFCYISTDGENWTLENSGPKTAVYGNEPIYIGIDSTRLRKSWQDKSPGYVEQWLGTIDLYKSYIRIYNYLYIYVPEEQTTVTLTFDPQGGTCPVETMEVPICTQIGELPKPQKEGMFFLGWYTEPDGGTPIWDFTYATRHATYYAHWTDKVETFPVTFVDNIYATLTYDDNSAVEIIFEDNIW